MRWNLPLDSKENSRLYWELSNRGAYCTGEKYSWRFKKIADEEFFSLALAQSRYDPRLLAILIDFFKNHSLPHPIRFKEILRMHDLLSLAAAAGEFLLELDPSRVVSDFFDYLQIGAVPVPNQLFFKNLYPIAGHKMEQVITQPVWAFKKWGFLLADPPLLKDRPPSSRTYLFDGPSRRGILKNLTQRMNRFRLRDYLCEVGFSISRQQALMDLKSFPGLLKQGKGKGTCYLTGA